MADVEMAGVEMKAAAPLLSLVEQLSTTVFEALEATGVDRCELDLDDELLLGMRNQDKIRRQIKNAVYAAYSRHLSNSQLDAAVVAAMTKMEEIQALDRASKTRMKILQPTPSAFRAPYVGDADEQFQNYLAACCAAYRDHTTEYTAPYVTVTQSSGFGKSRILQRLAETTAKGNSIDHGGHQFDVTVLYVCARNIKGSTGYPRATTRLTEWLFPKDDCEETQIGAALVTAFEYATKHSDAGKRWQVLFENGTDGKKFDDAIVKELKSAQVATQPEAKKQRTSKSGPSESKADGKLPVLVVAIDEARGLLEIKNFNGINAFTLLRRALTAVNLLGAVKDVNGSVFAILVDTNSQVHEFVPMLLQDPSSRKRGGTALFPPFILTQTMDVMLDDFGLLTGLLTSQSRVLDTDPDRVWAALVSMGRPLWRSMEQGNALEDKQRDLTKFAASKLLLGLELSGDKSYDDSTLHGVSSLFCRVGLRPHASDPMATRLVADFMSVLHYAMYKNDAHISSYTSDPILTFGASRMWYQLEPPALESHILRQFQAMLLNGVVDAGNIGEIVARIFLLLAMDATTMGPEVRGSAVARKEFVFSGQFCDVRSFVEILVGVEVEIRADKSAADPGTPKLYTEWLQRWEDWGVGFTHFVDLPEEPTEEILWKMLDRRAAGILSRNKIGADLIIPIFFNGAAVQPPESGPDAGVSFILVQIKNRVDGDDKFPASALENLTASHVFTARTPLQGTGKNKMIRLYMSLREVPNDKTTPAQCIVMPSMRATKSHDNDVPTFDGSLSVRGMFRPNPDADDIADIHQRWPFLSKELINQLTVIANSAWWDGKAQVEYDLDSREVAEMESGQSPLSRVLPKETALEMVSKTLGLFSSDGRG